MKKTKADEPKLEAFGGSLVEGDELTFALLLEMWGKNDKPRQLQINTLAMVKALGKPWNREKFIESLARLQRTTMVFKSGEVTVQTSVLSSFAVEDETFCIVFFPPLFDQLHRLLFSPVIKANLSQKGRPIEAYRRAIDTTVKIMSSTIDLLLARSTSVMFCTLDIMRSPEISIIKNLLLGLIMVD